MDSVENVKLKENNALVKQLVTHHNVAFLDHRSVCALALVDKDWHKAIKESTNKRKEYLRSLRTNPIIADITTWHVHGSAYAQIQNIASQQYPYFFYLKNGDSNVTFSTSSLTDTINCPFFDTTGKACFYMATKNASNQEHIIEYDLGENPLRKSFNSFVVLKEQQEDYEEKNAIAFQQFPVLLQAFFHSTKIKTSFFTHFDITQGIKKYYVSGIELDPEYVLNGKFPSQQIKDIITSQCKIKK
jgi:hypothetical protein